MSTLISSLSELIPLLIQSSSLSAIFPSFAFVLLNYLFIRPILSDTAVYVAFTDIEESIQAVILATVTIGLAYLLTATNRLIIGLFEGYPLIDQYPFDEYRRKHLRRFSEIRERINALDAEIKRLKQKAWSRPLRERPPLIEKQELLRAEKNLLEAEKKFLYPANERRILPTRLGNIIASAEDYPQQLFGIDTVLLWPYIVPTLAKSGYLKLVEREKATFDLLLNTTVLVAVFGLEIGYLDALSNGLTWRLLIELTLIGGATCALHCLTTRGAMGWGLTIRAAFVLHRDNLREALGLVRPESYTQERDLWERASDFYREPAEARLIGLSQGLFNYVCTDQVSVKTKKESEHKQGGKDAEKKKG